MTKPQHTLRHWIPPKLTPILSLTNTSRVRRIIDFYARLPRSSTPTVLSSYEWLETYTKKYFTGRGKGQPILHAIGGIILFGYFMG
ncbi:hypothetical protein T552_02323 [Pneumocystis carinii B80]|uniref:Uncharacterized protein n=1 Tax=Pneumocystis carinii (strain B80) TaxID=1408658 RepID=A0A0W4ZG31_PNEC8|nr:hypothetical protein T552_02323 [Pneumocystis carinii B80]KTW27340.1 hypothetical protein T552_02323 [Pneumocystis carinii B80]